MQDVRVGKGDEWREMFEKYSKPIYDDLVAKGVLASWAVHVEDVHTAPNTLRYVVTVSRSAEAEDQVEAAFVAASAKRSEAEREALGAIYRELAVGENHRDYMARVTAGWVK
jgi:hypothetical protein